jgi:hypothetical protein
MPQADPTYEAADRSWRQALKQTDVAKSEAARLQRKWRWLLPVIVLMVGPYCGDETAALMLMVALLPKCVRWDE